ncbi:hypothetical protein ACFLTT_02230 [Chloroflexota bacterium]
MPNWGDIKDVLLDITETAIEGSASGFVSLTKIGIGLITKGALKDYGSGQPTKRQLSNILSEIKKQGGSCEIIVKDRETLIKVNFQD